MAKHICPVVAGAGGLIDPAWCFEQMASVLGALPPIVTEDDMARQELLLFDDGRISLRYCPFDHVNVAAKVVIVGITPGRHQMFLSCREAQRALADGVAGDEVLERACTVGSFAGSMRTNLVARLDGIGLHAHLRVKTTAELFAGGSDLLHTTSAIMYPVFVAGDRKSVV